MMNWRPRLHLEYAECEYVSGRVPEAEEVLNGLPERIEVPLKRADICRILVHVYQALGGAAKQLLRGVACGGDSAVRPSRSCAGTAACFGLRAACRRGQLLTEGTIKNHVIHIFGKLQVNKRTHAVAVARQLKLLD